MKNVLKKINETGTLLIEAIAMLGLVSMVTPVLYKKAAERSAELQDINASSQLRAIASAMDSYLTDNFAKIVSGTPISNDADFSQFDLTATETSATISVSALKDYLPYGMMSGNNIRSTKLISNSTSRLNPNYDPNDPNSQQYLSNQNYKIVVKLNQQFDGTEPVVQTLTGFIIAEPKQGIVNNNRAARIASMVGSNGGYITGNNVNGIQGIWSVAKNDLDSGMQDNTIVISSLQPISSQGLSNEKVLHRVNMPNDVDQELNTMTTDLFMGKTAADTRNIRMVNQIVMMPNAARMVGGTDADIADHDADDGLPANNPADIENALYIGNRGGANIQGAIQAVESLFSVRENLGEGQNHGQGNPVAELRGRTTQNNGSTFHVGVDNMTYGNPGGTMQLVVNDTNLVYKRRDGENMLNVENSKVELVEQTLTVGDNFATLGPTTGTEQLKEVPLTTYGDNVEGTVTDSGEYRLTVDGSIHANDTIQGGKLAGYDVDSAKLRAGTNRGGFTAGMANDSDFFVMAQKTDENGSEFSLSDNEHEINQSLVYAKTGDNAGFTVDTSNYEGGIDLIAGDTRLLDENGAATNDTPQEGEIRLGASNGVFLSTYSATVNDLYYDTPVSIQGNILQVYRDSTANTQTGGMNSDSTPITSQGRYTVDMRTTDFFATNRNANNIDANYRIEGMELDVGRYQTGDGTTTAITANTSDSIARSAVQARSILNIKPDEYGEATGSEYGKVTTRITGGVGIYDHDANISANRNNPNSADNPAALFIDKGKFEIRATSNSLSYNVGTEQHHVVEKGDLILAVDNNLDTARYSNANNATSNLGSVYIRKGSINLASNRTRLTNNQIGEDYAKDPGTQQGNTQNPTDRQNMTGYIAADRFISHYANQGSDVAAINAPSRIARNDKIASATVLGTSAWTGSPYDKYEVNPAYTSVMHDIKLTTRGGARLSDILPDFINKGIYVVDTDYKEKLDLTNDGTIANWANSNFSANTCRNDNDCIAGANDPVSAYVGFVPTPKCPPGYAKVITLTPAGWAMAQAGKLNIKNLNGNNRPEVDIYDAATVLETNAQVATASETTQQPIYLDYQKSTWLRSEVRPVYAGLMNNAHTSGNNKPSTANFNGWGLIMGFIYPESQYQNLIADATATTTTSGVMHGAHGTSSATNTSSETVYWNLFPVYKSEIEGYATVYCYFDRSRSEYDNSYVDKYDQLGKYNSNSASDVVSHKKGGEFHTNDYVDRLNDDKLKYNEPW